MIDYAHMSEPGRLRKRIIFVIVLLKMLVFVRHGEIAEDKIKRYLIKEEQVEFFGLCRVHSP